MEKEQQSAPSEPTFERHYKLSELAKMWGIGFETVRRLVVEEDGVVRLSGPSGKTSYRVPESVARRIHTKLIAPKKRPGLTPVSQLRTGVA